MQNAVAGVLTVRLWPPLLVKHCGRQGRTASGAEADDYEGHCCPLLDGKAASSRGINLVGLRQAHTLPDPVAVPVTG